jgi:site-specific DNA recombinase
MMAKRTRQASEALLAGKLFDDRGNRMSPSWARKGSKRWRYYVSQAALRGDKSKAGSIVRVSAAALEALVAESIVKLSLPGAPTDVRNRVDCVTISRTGIRVHLSEAAEAQAGARTVTLPWTPPSPHRKRDIIQGVADGRVSGRPMRANARAILLQALGDAHRWLEELLSNPRQTLESLALQEGKSDRSIRMTLSLAFLAPGIVKAAVEERLPRGYGLKRLVDLPMAWPDQWRALGLEAPVRT